jgi:hypothetical protein
VMAITDVGSPSDVRFQAYNAIFGCISPLAKKFHCTRLRAVLRSGFASRRSRKFNSAQRRPSPLAAGGRVGERSMRGGEEYETALVHGVARGAPMPSASRCLTLTDFDETRS